MRTYSTGVFLHPSIWWEPQCMQIQVFLSHQYDVKPSTDITSSFLYPSVNVMWTTVHVLSALFTSFNVQWTTCIFTLHLCTPIICNSKVYITYSWKGTLEKKKKLKSHTAHVRVLQKKKKGGGGGGGGREKNPGMSSIWHTLNFQLYWRKVFLNLTAAVIKCTGVCCDPRCSLYCPP